MILPGIKISQPLKFAIQLKRTFLLWARTMAGRERERDERENVRARGFEAIKIAMQRASSTINTLPFSPLFFIYISNRMTSVNVLSFLNHPSVSEIVSTFKSDLLLFEFSTYYKRTCCAVLIPIAVVVTLVSDVNVYGKNTTKKNDKSSFK